MTEKEKAEIIEVVHSTLRGFFEPFFGEERPFTQTENVLLEVNKAICNKIREMPVDRPHGEWKDLSDGWQEGTYECSNCKAEFVLIEGTPEDNEYNFCPNCGADMREGDEK